MNVKFIMECDGIWFKETTEEKKCIMWVSWYANQILIRENDDYLFGDSDDEKEEKDLEELEAGNVEASIAAAICKCCWATGVNFALLHPKTTNTT